MWTGLDEAGLDRLDWIEWTGLNIVCVTRSSQTTTREGTKSTIGLKQVDRFERCRSWNH